MDVKGKVVIITGASAGIGRAAALCFARAGAKTVLAARSADQLANLAAEIAVLGQPCLAVPTDMCSQPAVERLVARAVEHFGRVDILVNNAGQAAAGSVAEVNPEYFRRILDLNIFGVVYAIQAVVPHMRQAGGGLIINISSMVSKMRLPGLGAYAATKAALNMLSDTARVELAPQGIKVTTVYPRMTATNFGRNSLGDQHMRSEQRSEQRSEPGSERRVGAPAARPGIVIDTAEYVAVKILLAAQTEVEEQFMDAPPSA